MTIVSAAPNNRDPSSVPLIEKRQGKPSAHRMYIDIPKPYTLPKTETVRTGKEIPRSEDKRGPKNRMDPELEELKGFKELGFEFSHDQMTPRGLILLPGLKRLTDHEKSKKINVGFQESALEKSELPSPDAAELDLKEYLKLWARCVASTLKS